MTMDAEKSQGWGPGTANGVSSSPRQKKTDAPAQPIGLAKILPCQPFVLLGPSADCGGPLTHLQKLTSSRNTQNTSTPQITFDQMSGHHITQSG